MKTELGIFDLTRSASWEEIKKAYREKMKKCHPDLNKDNVEAANKKSQDVNAAYEKLRMCLSQTGRFVCPVMTMFKRPSSSGEPDLGQTNIVDFFRPKEVKVEKSGSAFGFLFNLLAIILWLGVLYIGTVKGIEYFQSLY